MTHLLLALALAAAPQHAAPADTMTADGTARAAAGSRLAELKARPFDYKDKTVDVGLVTLRLGERSGHVIDAVVWDDVVRLDTNDLLPIVPERLAAELRDRFGDEVRARVTATVRRRSSGWLLRVTSVEVVDGAGVALATITETP